MKSPTSCQSDQAVRGRVGHVINVATLILVAVAVARRWADPWVVYVVVVAGMVVGYSLTRAERRR